MIVFGHPGMSLQEYVDNFTAFLTSKCSTGLQLECQFAANFEVLRSITPLLLLTWARCAVLGSCSADPLHSDLQSLQFERRCLFQRRTIYGLRDHQHWHSLVPGWNAYRFLHFVRISRLGNRLH
jgi:hypothetical protein